MKKIFLCGVMAMAAVLTTHGQTGSDYMQAMKVADTDIAFDVNAEGQTFRVHWGMDAAWNWDFNINRGVAHIGKKHLTIGRVAFQPTQLVIDNGDGTYELTAAQKREMKSRCDNIKNLTGVADINMTADQEAYYPVAEYVSNYYGKVAEWYKLIKASVKYCKELGMTVYSISPYNEPDYSAWKEGSQAQMLQLCKMIREDSYFDGIRICGGNTLNCDQALSWYNYLGTYLGEGNTHQLAGSFDSYANFFQKVKADGKAATADELHNVGEAIVGVQYGMENGIWWAFDAKARGQFCIDSNEGVRIGYGENRAAWTSGAVYRNEQTGEVHGYLGSSERQAKTSSFAFVSTAQDVYFNGYGPTRMYVYDVPGDPTGKYQGAQINAERLFDITWGEDVAPGVIDGTYQIMNASSKKMLTYKGTSNVQSVTRTTSGTTQQWKVTPGYTTGDISYWFIDNASTSASITATHLNVLNNNLNAGAGVICYDAGHDHNEQWYLKYAQDGYYYIISRLSNKYLYCSSTTSGAAVTLQDAPTTATMATALKRYLWRFQSVDSKAETKAPGAPTDLKAKQRAASVELSWTAPSDDDLASFTILRGTIGETETRWNTIGRNCTATTFVDNTVLPGQKYQYKVFAVDEAGNRSAMSETLDAAPLAEKQLLCQLQFDGSLNDQSANQMHASAYGATSFSTLYKQSGARSLVLEGNAYAMLPYAVACQDEMTIATWMFWNTTSNWQRLFDFGNGTTQYMFFTPSTGSEMRFVMKNGGDEQILTPKKALDKGAWHHVAVTLKPVDTKVQAILYIDGENVAESSTFTIRPSDIAPSLCYLGRSMFKADPFFNGRIDDFRIYNYALSADEVAAVMTDLGSESKDLDDSYEEVNTGISSTPQAHPVADSQWYDLQGRQTSAASKGILINSGKKFYKK